MELFLIRLVLWKQIENKISFCWSSQCFHLDISCANIAPSKICGNFRVLGWLFRHRLIHEHWGCSALNTHWNGVCICRHRGCCCQGWSEIVGWIWIVWELQLFLWHTWHSFLWQMFWPHWWGGLVRWCCTWVLCVGWLERDLCHGIGLQSVHSSMRVRFLANFDQSVDFIEVLHHCGRTLVFIATNRKWLQSSCWEQQLSTNQQHVTFLCTFSSRMNKDFENSFSRVFELLFSGCQKETTKIKKWEKKTLSTFPSPETPCRKEQCDYVRLQDFSPCHGAAFERDMQWWEIHY